MQRCRNCGTSNTEDSQFCEECGQSLGGGVASPPVSEHGTVAGDSGQARPVPSAPTTSKWADQPSVPKIEGTKIALSAGERLWRTYPLVHFRPFRRRARGTLYVTDSRIILHSQARKTSGRTSLLEEVRIESVTGFGSHIDRGLGFLGTILLIFWTLFGFVQLFKGKGNAAIGIIVLIFAVLVFLIAYYYGRLGLRIYTSNSTPGPVAFGNFGVSRIFGLLGPIAVMGMIIGGVQASDVLYCFPEKDAEAVVAELGALVFDLNRQGTLSGTQWESGD
jgi:hypothetical protein